VVPATAPAGKLTWTDDEAERFATDQMNNGLARLREVGADIDGIVEEGSPATAVEAVMQIERYEHHQPFDESIVSTLPPGMSHWLKQDLPNRLKRHYGIPVTHVVGHPAADRTS
jgi:hypothetical protein